MLSYVDDFKYLGHFISSDLSGAADIEREKRGVATRGNINSTFT